MQVLLATRSQARAAVLRVCDADIRRFCPGVQQGDGNLMECFNKAKQNMSSQCRKTVADAGYEATIEASASTTQVALSSTDLVNSLQGVEQAGPTITAASLRQMAAQSLKDPSRAERMNRAPLTDQLEKQAQLTIAIQFDFNSARIRPASFQAVGLMADALYHPYLQGYRFLIVGHTDGKGSREYNLKLSQQRAEAIRAALINPFGISPSRIESVGLGEEQLLRPADPEAAANRRVQLINIGSGR
jgi:outer membrane protein OmpA-like peptidoglycan-associated protein